MTLDFLERSIAYGKKGGTTTAILQRESIRNSETEICTTRLRRNEALEAQYSITVLLGETDVAPSSLSGDIT